MEKILETRGLTKVYGGRAVVQNLNITIEKGDIYGFIGKNGAGKTTTMRMVCGTSFPTAGTVTLFGGMPEAAARRRIGSLIEAPGLYPACTAEENLRRFALISGGNEKDIPRILSMVGLADAGNKKAGKFSLGMKQRLGIAIAMLGDPEFLVLDEPVNGLDPAGIKEVRDLILTLNREGVTFLISSHLLDELSKVATKFGIINRGMLAEEVTADELHARCKGRLVIATPEPERARDALAGFCDPAETEISSGNLVLFSRLGESAEVNRRLVLAGIPVNGIECRTEGLEDYFIERIGM